MKSVSRNVILDLLPGYIAGEASPESRTLVEEFARTDPEIATMIHAGALDPAFGSDGASIPDALEMKTIRRVRRSVRRQMIYVAIATASILLVPLVAMQFSDEVNWDPADFLVMAVLLLGAGTAFVWMTRAARSFAFRSAVAVAVFTGVLLTWVNLAVGVIGAANNPLNLLYFGVILIGLVGAAITRLRPGGMAGTMLIVAAAQLLIPIIALLLGARALEQSPGAAGVVIANAGFAALFGLSALLFWRADRTRAR